MTLLKETHPISSVLGSYERYSPFISALYHQLLKGGSKLELGCFLSDPLEPLPYRSHGRACQISEEHNEAAFNNEAKCVSCLPASLRWDFTGGSGRSYSTCAADSSSPAPPSFSSSRRLQNKHTPQSQSSSQAPPHTPELYTFSI